MVECITCQATEKNNDMMICYYCGRPICLDHSRSMWGAGFFGQEDHGFIEGDNYFSVNFCEECYQKIDLHNKFWNMLYEICPNKNEWQGMDTDGCVFCKKDPAKIMIMEDGHDAHFCEECYRKNKIEYKTREVVENNRPEEYLSIQHSFWRID